MFENAPDALVGNPQKACDLGHRHALAERDHEGLHHRGEARARTGPRDLALGRLVALAAGHPRHAGLDVSLELEEVQMLPAPGQTIVDRLIHRATRGARRRLAWHSAVKWMAPSAGRKSKPVTAHGAVRPSAWVKSCSIR